MDVWTTDRRYGSVVPMVRGSRFQRVTGWRYWWAYLNRARFSWIALMVIVVIVEVLDDLGWW